MISFFMNLDVPIMALICGIFTWLVTILGSSLVFVFKKVNSFVLNIMLGISAGIMLSASIWSLLIPAVNQSDSFLLISLSFMAGACILYLGDILCDRFFNKKKKLNKDNVKRNILLMFSITLHNIPEGLAIGVAFGTVLSSSSIFSAISLAIGIGIQNFPEGCAISLPLKRSGLSSFKSFMCGALSAIVEPIFAFVGALLVLKIQNIMPIFLSLASGAMLYVVIKELIPESQSDKKNNLITIFTLIGFLVMMFLDTL